MIGTACHGCPDPTSTCSPEKFKAMKFRSSAITLAAALALPLSILAGEADLTVVAPYVRMVPPGTPNSAAFMTIVNDGTSDRRLVKADSPVARAVELHSHTNEQGLMRMRQVSAIEVKAKGRAELKSGGYHVMLIDLRQPLKEGETVPLTLTFDDGSMSKVDAPVRKPQALLEAEQASAHGRH